MWGARAAGNPDSTHTTGRYGTELVNSGFAMMSSTRLHDRFSLRLCILNSRTTAADIDSVVDAILEKGRELGT